jgi:hypothetical protein
MPDHRDFDRRTFLRSLGAIGATAAIPASLKPAPAHATTGPLLTKIIPATGERIPAIGMGSWITFNVGRDRDRRAQRVKVLQTFFDLGGGLIDSSPMYGSSEEVIGHCLAQISNKGSLFSATKVWTLLRALGVRQMNASRELWGVDRFDLMQIHNMLDWSAHIETLKQWKAEGRIRYIGMTTSHGTRMRRWQRPWPSSRSMSCSSPTTFSTGRRNAACCRSQPSANSRSSSTGRFAKAH